MRWRKHHHGEDRPVQSREPHRIRFWQGLFMAIGILTVAYFLFTLGVIPLLALLTK